MALLGNSFHHIIENQLKKNVSVFNLENKYLKKSRLKYSVNNTPKQGKYTKIVLYPDLYLLFSVKIRAVHGPY